MAQVMATAPLIARTPGCRRWADSPAGTEVVIGEEEGDFEDSDADGVSEALHGRKRPGRSADVTVGDPAEHDVEDRGQEEALPGPGEHEGRDQRRRDVTARGEADDDGHAGAADVEPGASDDQDRAATVPGEAASGE